MAIRSGLGQKYLQCGVSRGISRGMSRGISHSVSDRGSSGSGSAGSSSSSSYLSSIDPVLSPLFAGPQLWTSCSVGLLVHVRRSLKWPSRKSRNGASGSMLCACGVGEVSLGSSRRMR